MALHKDFPQSPHAILDPRIRWFPADEDLRSQGYEKLLPPFVAKLRELVKEWRDSGYEGASDTTLSLFKWWFQTEHWLPCNDGDSMRFQYYFAQREAVETIVYLHEIAKVKDKYDMLRYDSSGAVSTGMFSETWSRFVLKMATGSGKTKVIALLLTWCYFHKLYEAESTLSTNFLVIVPNIIVLDRLRADFDSLRVFHEDPMLPDNGFAERDWQDDFNLTLHIQDEVHITQKTGNIFLTNIHRVYDSHSKIASFEDVDTSDYFLGKKPTGATNESKIDLSEIVRDIDELVVFNDEAHHVHDQKLAWFKSIEDINNRLKMKGSRLALQVDVTATPRHNNGAIFVHTVSDYPLVEAIHQNVVKHPVLPDAASRAKLHEKNSSKFTEKYEEYIHLGYLEWKNAYDEHVKMGKKAILFVMTDDTKNCDEVAAYLESHYPELQGAVLTIHTKENGEISEADSSKNKEELEKLRKAANDIDSFDNPHKAVVSVLMLKEGWDVKNVTTIVGLRAYSSKSNILPEQTLGRGLRRMYRGQEDVTELVSVVGTAAFMDFVESIRSEGVELEHRPMGAGTVPKAPLIIEVDHENAKKDVDLLDIHIPVLTPRIYREYKSLVELDIKSFDHKKIPVQQFTPEQQKEIIFRDISTDEITHVTVLDSDLKANATSLIGYFVQEIMRPLRLISGYDILYEKVKKFIGEELFAKPVDIDDPNTLRNLSELVATKTILETFKKAINALTVRDRGDAEIRDYIKISKCRPFVVKDQAYLVPKRSVFNRIVGDSHLEIEFAAFLDGCDDIVSYVKNYMAVHFSIDYVNADGDISSYYPDFIVKKTEREVFIIETKGLVDLDVAPKWQRLVQWCDDVNRIQAKVVYKPLYVEEAKFKAYKANGFMELVKIFG